MCYEWSRGTVPHADTPPPGASNYRTRINTQLLRHLPDRHVFSQIKNVLPGYIHQEGPLY